jgi:hypothetical protein
MAQPLLLLLQSPLCPHLPLPLLLFAVAIVFMTDVCLFVLLLLLLMLAPPQVDGYHLRVDRASAPRTTAATSSAAASGSKQQAAAAGGDKAGVSNPRCTVFVGNLDFKVGCGTMGPCNLHLLLHLYLGVASASVRYLYGSEMES